MLGIIILELHKCRVSLRSLPSISGFPAPLATLVALLKLRGGPKNDEILHIF